MHKRLFIVSIIILIALCGMIWLGYHSILIWSQGLEGARLGEFAAVAEQIRQDIKRKLDDFRQIEQDRPYTHYQYNYIPENIAQAQERMPLLRSPLADTMENSFAYGYFQIQPDGSIITPYDNIQQLQTDETKESYDDFTRIVAGNRDNITRNLLPEMGRAGGSFVPDEQKILQGGQIRENTPEPQQSKGKQSRQKAFPVQTFQRKPLKGQVIEQRRDIVEQNVLLNDPTQQSQIIRSQPSNIRQQLQKDMLASSQPLTQQQESQSETIQIKIGQFLPMVTANQNRESMFDKQIFLVRRINIEEKTIMQGFQLNEKKLIEEVKESALRLMREDMSFELSKTPNGKSAYTAILDFGFGNFILNLKEIDSNWLNKKINWMRNWYLSIITIVFLAVTLGLLSLWRNAHTQIVLAQKKDDFISAVSHELRTPLTSIRMYTEMLEKNWVKSQDKINEYYKSMRQESERLSRLIENVLDFSRIQKKRKKYAFTVGNINKCILDVVKIMRPYAAQNGFSIQTEISTLNQTTFDKDAVKQIVVNLLDNAIKYARSAKDKTITIRTKRENRFILIEVEDHGPGIPHRQRKKVFEQFYRCGPEATRETAGTGLGLALVKKFAEAHKGFVEIITAKPTGSILRVSLAIQKQS
ncbi:sensor histidine kinase [Planctomycetota bacterium]